MKGFIFGKDVSAVLNTDCISKTLAELWHGFSFRSGEIQFGGSNELIFKIGETAAPELRENETYAYRVNERGICCIASDKDSLIRGFLSLIQKVRPLCLEKGKESFIVHGGEVHDTFDIKKRMVHICVFPETKLSFLIKTVRLCAVLQYTHIILEFWGMLQYDCMNELAWPQAYTKNQAKDIIREIRELGMEPVPMFNHLGHASGSRMISGKHVVLDQNPRLQPLFTDNGWAWNIENPDVIKLMGEIRDELYELFGKGEFIHLGCDEAYNYGWDESLTDSFADYLSKITQEVLTKESRRPIIWGDMLLEKNNCGVNNEPYYYYCLCKKKQIADTVIQKIDRRIIIGDWQYNVKTSPVKTIKFFQQHGFEVIGCPWDSMDNVKAVVDTVRDNRSFGVMDTTWHTLKNGFNGIYIGAFLCDSGNISMPVPILETAFQNMAALSRKVTSGFTDYESAGWMESQI